MADKMEQFSMEDLTALARSPAGRELFSALQRADSTQLHRAMALAASGDMNGAGAALAPLLSDPRIRAMVEQLGGH